MTKESFKLVWFSQNEVVHFDLGEYATIAEASADLTDAKARLLAKYPSTQDYNYASS